MRYLFINTLLLGGALALAILLHTHSLFNSLNIKTPTVGAVALDDPKLKRTVAEFEDMSPVHKDPSRLEPVSRVGMVFHFNMPDEVQQMLAAARGWHSKAKKVWQEVSLAIDDRPQFRALIRVHGVSTTFSDKKSFTVDLLSAQQFTKEIRARKFFLLNLLHDPHAFKLRAMYILLSQFGLFPAYHQLAVVTINGKPEGMYLFVERPKDAIKRTEEVVSVIRVRRGGRIEEKYLAPGSNPTLILQELAQVKQINDLEIQAKRLEQLIYLDVYMRWLAINSLLQNGDSGDELFMYEVRKSSQQVGRLGFMAWDYDDIQSKPTHPRDIVQDELLWAAEGPFDVQIAQNPILYDRYRSVLSDVLKRLTDERMRNVLNSVREELDQIDTKFSKERQEKARFARHQAMDEFIKILVQRREDLLSLL